jgi:hypothetical protein
MPAISSTYMHPSNIRHLQICLQLQQVATMHDHYRHLHIPVQLQQVATMPDITGTCTYRCNYSRLQQCLTLQALTLLHDKCLQLQALTCICVIRRLGVLFQVIRFPHI